MTDEHYLVEWGGAFSDKAYKHAGELNVIGPFASVADAWAFCGALDDGLLIEWRQVAGFGVLVGRIAAVIDGEDTDPLGANGGLMSPAERLCEEYGEDGWRLDEEDALSPSAVAQLNRWIPHWRKELFDQVGNAPNAS